MPTEVQKIQAQMKKNHDALMKLATANQKDLKKKGEGDEERVQEMADLKKEMDRLIGQMKDIQVAGSPSAAKGSKGPSAYKSVARRLTEDETYKAWKENKKSGQKLDGVDIGKFFGRKAVETFYGPDNAGALVKPFYVDGVVEINRQMPIIRELARVDVATSADRVITDREVVRREIAANLTADVAIGQSVFPVDNVSGFDTTMPFNTFELDNGTLQQMLLIDSIQEDDLTITTTAVSTIDMKENDAVYGTAFTSTDEGHLVPNGTTKYEEYKVPVVEFSRSSTATLNKLRDTAGLENVIQTRLLGLLSEMETVNAFYSNGDALDKMTGIFYDGDVTEFKWSEQVVGTNIFDFFLICFYLLAKRNHTPTDLTVEPDVHKKFVDMKASDGHYLFVPNLTGPAPETVFQVNLRMTNHLLPTHGTMTNPDSIVLYDREDADVEIGTDGKDLTNRKRTLVGTERVALAIEKPRGLLRIIFDGPPVAP